MRESEVEKHLVKRAQELGGVVRKVAWVGRRGAPDRVVMLPGRLLWVELKRPGGKASPHQAREHLRMAKVGQVVHLIDSIDAVERLLK